MFLLAGTLFVYATCVDAYILVYATLGGVCNVFYFSPFLLNKVHVYLLAQAAIVRSTNALLYLTCGCFACLQGGRGMSHGGRVKERIVMTVLTIASCIGGTDRILIRGSSDLHPFTSPLSATKSTKNLILFTRPLFRCSPLLSSLERKRLMRTL